MSFTFYAMKIGFFPSTRLAFRETYEKKTVCLVKVCNSSVPFGSDVSLNIANRNSFPSLVFNRIKIQQLNMRMFYAIGLVKT